MQQLSEEVTIDELRAVVKAWKLEAAPETLCGYASVLRKHRAEDVRIALAQLVEEARVKPRKTLPHIGIIVSRVRAVYLGRVARLTEPRHGRHACR